MDIPELDPASLESQYLRFNSLGLAYHKTWSLYSCLQCERGILPGDIEGHMRKQHGVQYNLETKDELEQALRLYPGRVPSAIEVYINCNFITWFISVLINYF